MRERAMMLVPAGVNSVSEAPLTPCASRTTLTGRSDAGDATVVLVRELLHEHPIDLERHLPQQPRLLRVRQERALEAVDEDALHLVGAQPERARRQRQLLRDAGRR